MFKHILVAADGSERADKALSTAIALADSCGAALTALLVVPDYTTYEFAEVTFANGPSFDQLRKSFATAGLERLGLLLDRHSARQRVTAKVVVSDVPHDEIVKHAQQLHCDLIVMASRGRGAMKSALLGSQTLEVIADSPVPVLVTK